MNKQKLGVEGLGEGRGFRIGMCDKLSTCFYFSINFENFSFEDLVKYFLISLIDLKIILKILFLLK